MNTAELIVRISNMTHQIAEASARGFTGNSAALALIYEASDLMDKLAFAATNEFHGISK